MPESPSDDPFADLFGNLPDPRSRDARPSFGDTDSSYRPTSPSAPAPGGTDGAPLSRRAARELAARQGGTTVETPAGGVSAQPVAAPLSAPAAPIAPEPFPSPAAHASGPGPDATRPKTTRPAAIDAAGPAPTRPLPVGGEPTSSRTIADIFSVLPGSAAQLVDEKPAPAAAAPSPAADDPWSTPADDAVPALPYSRGGAASREPRRETPAPSNGRRASDSSLEDLFSGNGTTDDFGDVPPPPDKRKRRKRGWIALGIVLAILGGIAAGALYVWNTYEEQIREVMGWEEPKDYEPGLANGEAFVTIASGDTGQPISQSLYDQGVTKTPDAFYDYLIDTGQNPPFVPGVFQLQKQMTSEAALAALLDPANKMENTAQLREGLTVAQSLPILAEATGIPVEQLQAATADPSAYGVEADSLEGWLFPATYTFNPDVTAEGVVQTLVNRTVESLDNAGVPAERRQEILTIASIIEREARYEADMQKVSTVIQNRLDPSNQETFGKLQMDSTAQFGYGELHDGSASSSEEALNDPNPWNTYYHTGLPIGPIANPGDVAIDAAMHPAEGPWLYFVTVNMETGETIFTETYAEHLRYVDQMRAWCSDHPDAGC